MANAVTATGDDISCVNSNAANLSALNHKEVFFSYTAGLEEIKTAYTAYAHPARWGTPIVEFMSLDYGEFDKVDRAGANIGKQSPSASAFGLGWSTNEKLRKKSNLDFGVTARYIQSDLSSAKATAFSANIGAHYRLPFNSIVTGVAVNNLGTPVKYTNDSVNLPTEIRLGAGYVPKEFMTLATKIKLELDGVLPLDGELYPAAGAEISVLNLFGLNAGYLGEKNAEGKIRFGFSAGVEALSLSYSVTPAGDLGTTHQAAMRFRFGPDVWNLFKFFSKNYYIEQDIRTAQAHFEKGEYDMAVLYANKALRQKPDEPDAKRILNAVTTQQMKEMAALLYTDAMNLFKEKKNAEAFEKISQVTELDPENKDYQQAYNAIRGARDESKAVAVAPAPPTPSPLAAFSSITAPKPPAQPVVVSMPREKKPVTSTEFRPSQAEGLSVPTPSADDPSLAPDYDAALRQMQARNLNEAVILFRKVTAKNTNYRDSALKLSECLKARGIRHFANREYTFAVSDFTEALTLNPADPHLKKFIENAKGLQ